MKATFKTIMFGLSFLILCTLADNLYAKKAKSNSNKNYIELKGKVIDQQSKKPLVFATIAVEGENTATISNLDGEFLLKVDKNTKAKNLIISYLGYKNLKFPIQSFGNKKQKIEMQITSIALEEVIIYPNTPEYIVRLALEKVGENYEVQPNSMTAFFREYIKKKRNYISLAEAVLNIYKSNYINEFGIDQTKIIKGRKSSDKRKLDTLLFKVQGGPATILLLDLVKNPDILFNEENWKNYTFSMESQVKIYDRINYVIKFEQAYKSENPMHNGRLFIDAENYAISGAEFELNVIDKAAASRLFLRKKPAGVKLTPEKAVYKVMYKENDGKWFFNYAHAIANFTIKWDKKLFASNYTTMLEIAITDNDRNNAERMKSKEQFKRSDFFSEEVKDFYDADFWGEYNTIIPDESIENAIRKLKRINR